MADTQVRVNPFGRFEVWREGILIEAWPQRKTQLLLKLFLSERGRPFTLDELVECLYPEDDPQQAVQGVHARISELRHLLEPRLEKGRDSQFIVQEGAGSYVFKKGIPCCIDIEEFRKSAAGARRAEASGLWLDAVQGYEQAIDLYQGDYLAEDRYEEWTIAPRERLRELYLTALERLAESHARMGQYRQAVERCQEVIALDRYREDTYRQLMRYHYWLDEYSKISQVFRRCCSALQELEVTPSPKTEALYQQIRQKKLPQPQVEPMDEPRRKPGKETLAPAQAPRPSGFASGERRPLTAMVCHLMSESTVEAPVAEGLPAVVQAYREICTPIVRRFEGAIAQYSGDQLTVYFGYPQAHEDDPQRAAYAGLRIVRAMEHLNQQREQAHSAKLGVRIGIHTASATMGELASEMGLLTSARGPVPTLASRLADIAEPYTVVVSADTCKLTRGYCQAQDLGPLSLEGIPQPVHAYRVLHETGFQSRFELAAVAGLTPLVGRDKELGLLLDHWEHTQEGKGQVLLISGEAGVGKSRLVQEFQERLSKEPHDQLACHGSPYHQNSAFYALIELLRQALRFEPEDSAAEQWSKLEGALSRYCILPREAVQLFAAMLSIPLPARYAPLTMSPDRQKQKTLEALLAMLLERSEQQPLLLVLEDLHWIDPSTLEWLTLLVDQVPTAHLCALLTYRPEQFHPPWPARTHMIPVTVGALTNVQTRLMVQRLAGKPLPSEVVESVAARAGGIPLFVEELTKVVLESGLIEEREERYDLVGELSLTIPDTLKGGLMARLDRLGGGKELAQRAAVLGPRFPYKLLKAIVHQSEEVLQNQLAQLVNAELLYQRGLPPQSVYAFKHALIQEAAYDSLLGSNREQYHRQIAEALHERFPDTVETQPELLAHHYTEALQTEPAIGFWLRAGQRATARSANVEAIVHLKKGLQLLERLPETRQRDQQELELLLALGTPLLAVEGWGGREQRRVNERARQLCQRLGDTPSLKLYLALVALYFSHIGQAEYSTATELAQQIENLGQRLEDLMVMVAGRSFVAFCDAYTGQFMQSREALEQTLAFYDPQKHAVLTATTGVDMGVGASAVLSHVLWFLGYPDRALARSEESIQLARKLKSPFGVAFALAMGCWAETYGRRGRQRIKRCAEELMQLSTEHGFPYQIRVKLFRAWLLVEEGHVAEGSKQLRQALENWQSTGSRFYASSVYGWLGEALAKAGNAEEGLRVVEAGLAFVAETGETMCEAELHRLKGDVLRMQGAAGSAAKAEASFSRALEVARQQSAKSWELRAAMSLGRLWLSQGKREEARGLLAEVYNWFTEGFDTPDLQEAKALLTELS